MPTALAPIDSAALWGIEGRRVVVTTTLLQRLPGIQIVGLPESAARETAERVRSAAAATGLPIPRMRVVVELAPPDLPKGRTVHFALPIALSVIRAATGGAAMPPVFAIGELSLDGHVRPVRGAFPLVRAARAAGHRLVIVPRENGCEAARVPGVRVAAVSTLAEAVEAAGGQRKRLALLKPICPAAVGPSRLMPSFKEAGWKPLPRATMQALAAAVKARKSILLVAPRGGGAAMVGRRLPSLLPPLSRREVGEVAVVWSAAGLLPPGWAGGMTRPFRAPHHTASTLAMAGGGSPPFPGEVTLAHKGVLLLDEVGEFPRSVGDVVRAAWREKAVAVGTPGGVLRLPADFRLVGIAYREGPGGTYGLPGQPVESVDAVVRRLAARGWKFDRIVAL